MAVSSLSRLVSFHTGGLGIEVCMCCQTLGRGSYGWYIIMISLGNERDSKALSNLFCRGAPKWTRIWQGEVILELDVIA